MRLSRRGFLAGSAAALAAGTARAAGPGWHLPDEAAPHLRTFMQWPVHSVVYRDSWFRETVQETIADIANTIADFEEVVMLMAPEHESRARRVLTSAIQIWPVPTEDLWCRDSGPVFVNARQGSGQRIVDLNFNGWGNKQVHRHDAQVARRVGEILGLEVHDSGVTGELGGLEWDGAGTLMAHESSWVNPNRNQLSRSVIEQRLTEALGHSTMIWAPGLAGEDITDYHIDSLARFSAPGHVLIQLPEEPDFFDPFHDAAQETFQILKSARSGSGGGLSITVIPDPIDRRVDEEDFVASYVNYYVCNGAVISAEFGDARTDNRARQTLAKAYPGREIVQLNVDALGLIGGGIHCATQQQPVPA